MRAEGGVIVLVQIMTVELLLVFIHRVSMSKRTGDLQHFFGAKKSMLKLVRFRMR